MKGDAESGHFSFFDKYKFNTASIAYFTVNCTKYLPHFDMLCLHIRLPFMMMNECVFTQANQQQQTQVTPWSKYALSKKVCIRVTCYNWIQS